MNKLVEQFEMLLLNVKREGIDDLVSFIRKSDFYIAPASTRFHSSHQSGLLEHSLNVYQCLKYKRQNPLWAEKLSDISDESLVIVSLLHDLCKTYFYTIDYRNKKNEDGKWERVPFYTVDNKIPYGHGEKSVMMIEEYIKLLPVERYAIRWHMGYSEPKESYNDLEKAMEKYPLCLALQEADQEAANLLEEEN